MVVLKRIFWVWPSLQMSATPANMLTESLKRNTEPDFPVSFSLTSDPQKL
jgi:hypothetical protein